MRDSRVRERTALGKQLRGPLAEYGAILPQGMNRSVGVCRTYWTMLRADSVICSGACWPTVINSSRRRIAKAITTGKRCSARADGTRQFNAYRQYPATVSSWPASSTASSEMVRPIDAAETYLPHWGWSPGSIIVAAERTPCSASVNARIVIFGVYWSVEPVPWLSGRHKRTMCAFLIRAGWRVSPLINRSDIRAQSGSCHIYWKNLAKRE